MAKAPKASSKGGGKRKPRLFGSHGGGTPGPNVSPPPAGSPAALKKAAAARARAQAKLFAGHKPRVVKHPKAKTAARGLTPGDMSCCVAQALAASLQSEGFPVTDDDVLALHLLIAGPDEYVTIEDGLEAAAQYGLAGLRPSVKSCASASLAGRLPYSDLVEYVPGRCLILGVTEPAPHAVCDDGSGWWSWGQQWEPWTEPDEAWSVSWQL